MVLIGIREYRYRGMIMSHMAASTVEELHAMAKRIGVAGKHFQNKPGRPHYDVCKSMKKLAIAAGAKLVDDREIVRMLQSIPQSLAPGPQPRLPS